jgi:hypothetical protein
MSLALQPIGLASGVVSAAEGVLAFFSIGAVGGLGGWAVGIVGGWRPGITSGFAIAFFIVVLLLTRAGYRLLAEKDEIANATPVLRFSEPLEDDNSAVDGSPARTWRVELGNEQRGTQALNVRAKIHSTTPALFSIAAAMHETHNNRPPFRQQWNIAFGQPIPLDVLSEDVHNPGIYYLYRSDGDERSYMDLISGRTGQAITDATFGDGVKFTLRAVADPPTKGIEQEYALRFEPTGVHMRKLGAERILE